MKHIQLSLLFLLSAIVCSGKTDVLTKTYPANTPEIEYIGRTLINGDGSVSFDWSGTYLYCRFTGPTAAIRVSDTKKNYYNLFIDGNLMPNVVTTFGKDSVILLASELPKGEHIVCLQKRTEGEQGMTTIHSFLIDNNGTLLPAKSKKKRLIEYIGDSLTCGFGTEGEKKDDPFLPETENCNLAYGAILARFFDADYVFLAHSGRGLVRNYGDTLQVSNKGTLNHRIGNVFDEQNSPKWDYTTAQHPDVVVINLGSNDFSTRPRPTEEQFIDGYKRMVAHLRSHYGNVPIICVAPRVTGGAHEYIKHYVESSKDPKLFFAAFMQNYCNSDSDLGSVGHPNYQGQRKMAMTIAPYLSTATGWSIPNKPIE